MTVVQPVLDAGGPAVLRLMDRVEERMADVTADYGHALARHAGETISAGGKRLRPLLVCLAAGVPPPETEGLVRAAVAVELVHGATLVRASSELAQGELMQRGDAWRGDVSVERYLERCRLKTAVLFRAACELGALEGRGSPELLAAFGERIGLAFQILDDVLDVSGPPERTGKPRGADLLDGTVTLPLIEARARDDQLARVDLRAVRTPAAAEEICERIAATGALELARERAFGLVADAKATLPALPERQRLALALVADGVVERYA
jgi:geranylgeranyl pyrophosphate synthase